jgi:hypothetical protein
MVYSQLGIEATCIKQTKNISIFDYGKGCYEIVFHHGSHEAVDEWLIEIAKINALYSSKELVRYLVNTAEMGDEQIPIIYVFRRSQDFVRAHPERPITRTLILHAAPENNALVAILNIFTSWLSGHKQETARFLPIQATKEGMEWLMGE